MSLAEFPIDLSKFDTKLALDPTKKLSPDEKKALEANIQLFRDAIVFFTATGAARGVSGHTGGAYDTAPEVCILLALFNHSKKFYPVIFDEAGHRVATQYLLAALEGSIPAEQLLHYREANSHLPGHPELGFTPGVKFSSGRLGHMWCAPFCPSSTASPLPTATRSSFVSDPTAPSRKATTPKPPVIPVKSALAYFEKRGGFPDFSDLYSSIKPNAQPYTYIGSTKEVGATRVIFGEAVNLVLDTLSKDEAARRVMVIDSDLEGSTGLKVIHQKHPEVFVPSGIMERGNFSAAAGFGFEKGKVGVFSTFSAFLEMVISEVTMARLNKCNVLCHFSHSGGASRVPFLIAFYILIPESVSLSSRRGASAAYVAPHRPAYTPQMADNTCHFGVNSFFADNGLSDTHSALYFPADGQQMIAIIKKVFFEPGLRFVFSTRSKVPWLLREDGSRVFGDAYEFHPGKDEIIQAGSAGYIVAFGEMVYRSWDAVLRLRKEGIDVGLVNKPSLNMVDEETIQKVGQSPFVLVVESFNQKTGLGSKFGTWLLERRLTPKYGYMGSTREGS
ncbi:hypothetical protein C0993_004577 [Termitomyces sp. T159_Od127]|nr:hypothetical protein C0993_004577 [Termitomyces sp. T159_Od127]